MMGKAIILAAFLTWLVLMVALMTYYPMVFEQPTMQPQSQPPSTATK